MEVSTDPELNIAQNALINKLEKALTDMSLGPLPQDLVVVQGFVGDSKRGDGKLYKRLYSSLEFNECIEFSLHDVVTWQDMEPPDPLSRIVIWLKPDANIASISAQTTALEKSFLQGKIARAFGPPSMQGLGDRQRIAGSGGCGTYGAQNCVNQPTGQTACAAC